MQLVEAVILLFVGLVPGVWATLVDVYAADASLFSTRIALLLLAVVLLSCNMRYRRQATWGSAWLSLGCVESYYLSSSYTFAGMSRSTVAPLALLSVAAAGLAWVSWTAKHERGAFGLALKVLVLVVTLVACVATHDGIGVLDLACTLAIGYCLFLMRSRRVALERQDAQALAAADNGTAHVRRNAGQARSSRRASARTGEPSPRQRVAAEAPTGSGSRSVTTLRLKRSARPQPAGASSSHVPSRGRRASDADAAARGRGSTQRAGTTRAAARSSRPSSQGASEGSKGTGNKTRTRRDVQPRQGRQANAERSGRRRQRPQRPTKRTGGAVPEANRMRSSSADGHGRAGAKPHRRTGSSSGPRSHR